MPLAVLFDLISDGVASHPQTGVNEQDHEQWPLESGTALAHLQQIDDIDVLFRDITHPP